LLRGSISLESLRQGLQVSHNAIIGFLGEYDLAVSFDRVAGIYDATRWSSFPPELLKKLLRAMKETLAGCRTILDVGIGTGRFAEYLNDSGFNIVGIDISLSMMAKAREKRLQNLVQGDAHHLPFRDRAFDGAIMIHILHLVHDWARVVGEVGRVTRKVIVAEVEGGEGFSPRARYLELRREMGYPLDRFNDGEAGLRRVVPPRIVKLVGDYFADVDVHEEIDSFDKRKSSVSWDIPTEVNGRIIQRLHSENPEKIVRRREIVEVVGWDPTQLRRLNSQAKIN
jgi:ubiquinone/menaquinone biosynthesis C-methylase UbiE